MPPTRQPDPLELLDRRWSPQVLIHLLDGPQRFVQLAAEIPGVSRRMLTERLRELEAGGVVTRHVESGPPISVTYSLAQDGGGELATALRSLRAWAASKAS